MFDSGVGGLTVAAAVRKLLPNEDIVYLGDTARVPYGIKSPPTVSQFARQLAGWLLQHRPKLMVVACNTLSAVAMPELEAMGLQVLGVVEPGARPPPALVRAGPWRSWPPKPPSIPAPTSAPSTPLTPPSPSSSAPARCSCPWPKRAATATTNWSTQAAFEYLEPIRRLRPGVVVLGCTHYPLLRDAIASAVNGGAVVVDSAEETPGPRERSRNRK